MVRLTDRPNMDIDVYRGRKTTQQQQQHQLVQSREKYNLSRIWHLHIWILSSLADETERIAPTLPE